MISLDLLLKHMQWANKEIYTEVSKLDSEVLDYYVIDPEWKIKTIEGRRRPSKYNKPEGRVKGLNNILQ